MTSSDDDFSPVGGGTILETCSACAGLVPLLAFPDHAAWHRDMEPDAEPAVPTGQRMTL